VIGVLALVLGGLMGLLAASVSDPIILIGGLLGLAVLVGTLFRPQLGLMVLIFLSYTRFSDVLVQYHNAPSVMKSFVPLLLAALVVRWAVYGDRPWGWGKALALTVGYGLVGAASLFYAQYQSEAFTAISDYVKDVTIALVIVTLVYRGSSLRRAVWAALAAGILVGTLSVYQFLTGTFNNIYGGFAQVTYQSIMGDDFGYRIAGPVGDPNPFAFTMLMLVPLALDRLLHERKIWLQLLAGWALVVCTAIVIVTYSRGAFVALLVVAAFIVLRHHRNFKVILAILLIVAALLPFLPEKYLTRMGTLLSFLPGSTSNPMAEPSFFGRTSEMTAAWLMFVDHPLLGVGLGNSPKLYFEYAVKTGLTTVSRERGMHSLYLEIAAETGLAGLIAFGAILLAIFLGIRRARSDLLAAGRMDLVHIVNGVEGAMVAFAVCSVVIHGTYPRYFWTLAGIAFSLVNVARYELSVKEDEQLDGQL